MSLSLSRKALVLVVSAGLVVAALLATASAADAATIYACKKPSGTLRLVSRSTRCRRGQTKISWGTSGRSGKDGRNGTNGANGSNGQNGARGPAGAFDVIDAAGANVGLYAGYFLFGPMLYLPNGAVLIYDNNPATPYPQTLSSTLFYKQAGCGGTPYMVYGGTWPFEMPTVLQSPPSPGSPMYTPVSATVESFTYQSTRTISGCRDGSGAANPAYPVAQNGVVPIVQEPLRLRPVS